MSANRPHRRAHGADQVVLKIKNMVCDRCIRVVREELTAMGCTVDSVVLGEAAVRAGRNKPEMGAIRVMLERNGFELLDDRRTQRVEQIKQAVIRYVRGLDGSIRAPEKFAIALARGLHADYDTLSALFSSVENTTVEHFVILQKIERVKELLVYNQLTLSEISYTLGYSSVQHLSSQFKVITGFTPTAFKRLKTHTRTPLDKVA